MAKRNGLVGAALITIVEDFIRSCEIWKHEPSEPIARSKEVIKKWCEGHGARADIVTRCGATLREGLRQFSPIFLCNDANQQMRLRGAFQEWSKIHPEIHDHWPRISLYLAEDGLVTEYLRGASPRLFRQRSDRRCP
jgi:hypothetical protein